MRADNNSVNEYINSRYDRWLEYATYHCVVSRLNIDPAEVLNDVLCSLLERDHEELKRLMSTCKGGYTELDYFVLHIIKTNIHSPRSQFRYTKGQYCTHNIEGNESYITALATQENDFDLLEHYDRVKEVLESLELPKRSKQIFTWKFFEGNSLKDCPGTESLRSLFNIYNRVLLIIAATIKMEQQDYLISDYGYHRITTKENQV